jgi:glycosyltransferase involved in cell wall biosynthesis
MKKSKNRDKNKKGKGPEKTRKTPDSPHIKNRPTISVCLIVKDEERFLDNCLKSVKDIANEIIVIDTGSTDNTVEIAKRFTDKVHFHTWENSFCKARNQALHYATGKWILQIDADEELMEGNGNKIQHAIEKAKDADAIFVKLISPYAYGKMITAHNYTRLFKNNGKIRYEGNIHERVVGSTKAVYSDIELWHYGYNVEDTKADQKFLRTTKLLKKEIENEPDNPLYRHYLCGSYISRNRFHEAIDEAEKAIALLNSRNIKHQAFASTYYLISRAFCALGQYDQAKKYALEALDKYPGHMDSYYILTFVADKNGEWDDVIQFGQLFLDKLESNSKSSSELGTMSHNTLNEGPAVALSIGHSSHKINDLVGMRDFYKKAYDMSDTKWKVLWSIVVHHLEISEDIYCAGEYLSLALKEDPEKNNTLYMLADYSKKCGLTDKELDVLENLVKTGSNDKNVINRLFSLYIEKEKHEKSYGLIKNINDSSYPDLLKLGNYYFAHGNQGYALQCYMKAVEIKPDSPEAWSILAEIMLSLGKYEDSQVFMEKALTIKENDLPNLLTMCELRLLSGDIESHVKYCDKMLEILGLDRNRTIDNFVDLKNIFIEIGNLINKNGINYSSKINNIISRLDSYIAPAA